MNDNKSSNPPRNKGTNRRGGGRHNDNAEGKGSKPNGVGKGGKPHGAGKGGSAFVASEIKAIRDRINFLES